MPPGSDAIYVRAAHEYAVAPTVACRPQRGHMLMTWERVGALDETSRVPDAAVNWWWEMAIVRYEYSVNIGKNMFF